MKAMVQSLLLCTCQLECSFEHAIVQTAKAHFKVTGGTRSLNGLSENFLRIRRTHGGGIPLEDDERVEDELRGCVCGIEQAECWETVNEVERAWKTRVKVHEAESEVRALRICEEH
ncbi:hypothetical protein EDD18DRAFT_1206399 [Armillaria luteobubalina]|uniref:Uncharacterized protein n=1 Tax=Armillaria luteobubalina TaxID=153913 RepID=A0AA39P9A2_9AGAR|nr:hypothetical protein EDD18DRAFT_1206399 [Armillaria luteobubalina]